MEAHFAAIENSALGRAAIWVRNRIAPGMLAVGVTVIAIVLGFLNYLYFGRSGTAGPERQQLVALLIANATVGLTLVSLITWQLAKIWLARRRGAAGAKLHSRFVALFSIVAIIPAIFGISFAVITFNYAAEDWFGKPVQVAVENSVKIADAYVDAHWRNMAAELPELLQTLQVIQQQAEEFDVATTEYKKAVVDLLRDNGGTHNFTAIYLLTEDGSTWASHRQPGVIEPTLPREPQFAAIQDNTFLPFTEIDKNQLQGLVRVPAREYRYVFAIRSISPHVLEQAHLINEAAKKYEDSYLNLFGFQFAFILTYILIAILVLLAAIWLGLWAATRMVLPIGDLVSGAERVSDGDLSVRVTVSDGDDEIATLGRTFNRMTGQLYSQRHELIEANRQMDERRQFTEAVLSGVSAGVVGLDSDGCVTIANKSAYELLEMSPKDLIGRPFLEVLPEIETLLKQAGARGPAAKREVSGQVELKRSGGERNFNVRISREFDEQQARDLVITFDDISELVVAQRTSAWADVARRIAHEIKNPLTPIQLSAERLRRKYSGEITTDPAVFDQCTETIIRQVNDIGKMVDEFSSFARMPAPVMKKHDLNDITRQCVFMQRVANQDITYDLEAPEGEIELLCDGRLVSQALTNILKNAGEAVATRTAQEDDNFKGAITVRLADSGFHILLEITDNGCGLPSEHRHRLTEPYMTTRQKGTGLGLAIVRKVMEDHEGDLIIDDAPAGKQGAMVRMVFPHRSLEQTENRPEPVPTNVGDAAGAIHMQVKGG